MGKKCISFRNTFFFHQNLRADFPPSSIPNPVDIGKDDWLSFLYHWCLPYIRAFSIFFTTTKTNETNKPKLQGKNFFFKLSYWGKLSNHFCFSLQENRTVYGTALSSWIISTPPLLMISSKSMLLFFYQILEYRGLWWNFLCLSPFSVVSLSIASFNLHDNMECYHLMWSAMIIVYFTFLTH